MSALLSCLKMSIWINISIVLSAYNANHSSEHSRLYFSISASTADKTNPVMCLDKTDRDTRNGHVLGNHVAWQTCFKSLVNFQFSFLGEGIRGD